MTRILTEATVLPIQEIDDDTKDIIIVFQEILRTLYTYYHENNKYADKRGSLGTIENFKKFKQELKRFHNYPFVGEVMKQIDDINKQLIDLIQAQRQDKKLSVDSIRPSIDAAKAAWREGNRTKILQASKVLLDKMDSSVKINHGQQGILQSTRNPMYIENPLFFGSVNFLKVFEKDEIQDVINKDINVYKYSYLKLPRSRFNDFQFVAYYILKLQKEPGEIEMSKRDLSDYYQMAYSDDKFAKLIKIVKEYLSSNQKSLLPQIMELVGKFPEIIQGNKDALANLHRVYRGVTIDDEEPLSVKEIIRKDKEQPFVATSESKHVAKRFALSIGHLESTRSARSSGYVLEYQVDEESLVLDTSIFGGIFGENEIIINPSKATVVDYERFDPEEDNSGW